MLSQLFINNIAVIERASIDFGDGFNVLTGETGAGKSIIIDAIHAVLGERTSRELIRSGEKTASVSAVFTSLNADVLAILKEFSVPMEDGDELLLHREIRPEGKSVCKINGIPATVAMLKTLGQKLIAINGQHESYELMSPEVHMSYLDSYGELESLLERYQQSYISLREIQKAIKKLEINEEEKERRVELLTYQINEIEEAEIKEGERDKLLKEREIIRNKEKIAKIIDLSQKALLGDEESTGVLSGLTKISDEVGKITDLLPEFSSIYQKVVESTAVLEEVETSFKMYAEEYDTSSLDDIEARLDVIYKLSRKYGENESDILSFLEKCKAELSRIENMSIERENLDLQYEEEKERAISYARELSKKRQDASERFCENVKAELCFLNMPGIEFDIEILRVPLYMMGCDKIQFLVSANKGEQPKPMSKTASGGELSRIMLAIKTVLSGKDKISTLIFDEVDTGVSGEAANKVGLKLKQVSKNRQVLCITHLPQIASLADVHFRIDKTVTNERTFTQVEMLELEERKQELARIMGGKDITPLHLKLAGEMIEKGLTT